MRIALWGNVFPAIGGIERFVTNLGQALVARGHRVHGISAGTGSESDLGFPVSFEKLHAVGEHHWSQDNLGEILKTTQRLRKTLKDFSPDVIHYHPCGYDLFVFDRVIRSINVPLVTTLHLDMNDAFWSVPDGMGARLLELSDAVTIVSEAAGDAAMRQPCFAGRSLQTIPNSLPIPPAPREASRPGQVLAIGRMVKEKGFDVLLQAVPKISASYPGARFIFAGDGPEREALRDRARQMGLAEAVAFPGWIEPEEVHLEMQRACLVVVPSLWLEPFGLVALEAALAARPVVASAVGGLKGIVRNGETGRLVPPGDSDALADAIASLLQNPEAAKAMGVSARADAKARFDFDRMVNSYEATLGAAAAKAQPRSSGKGGSSATISETSS